MLGCAFRLACLAGKSARPGVLLGVSTPRWSNVEFSRSMSSGEGGISSSIWRFFSGSRCVPGEVASLAGASTTEPVAPTKRPTGLHKKCSLRGPLATFMGKKEASRVEVVRFVWSYIKERGLQRHDNKRIIVADAQLLPLVQTPELSMFELNKVLNKYIENLPTENTDASASATPKSQQSPETHSAPFSGWN